MRKIENYWSLLAIYFSLLFLIFTVVWASDWNDPKKVITSDATYYYSYLPAFFIFADPDFNFARSNTQKYGSQVYLEITENGRNNVRTSIGVAYLYSPFFFLANAFATAFDIERDGYSWIYRLTLILSGVFYLFLALVFLRKVLLFYFSDKITAIGLLLVLFATNLFYYSAFENSMSHVYSFFMLSVFLFFMINWFQNPNSKNSFSLGFWFGLIVLIRPSNIVFGIIPILWGISSKSDFINRLNWFLKNLKTIPLMFFAAIIPWLPQMVFWFYVSGNFIHYSYPAEAKFYFLDPHFIEGLFSYRKGWFLYTPIMLIAFLSIFLLKKYAKDWFLVTLIFVVVNGYIILSWPIWWYGGGFGQRAFIDSYPLMIIPICALIKWVSSKKWIIKYGFSILALGFVCLNLFQIRQYRSFSIHWDSMSKGAYWANFGKMKPVDGLDTLFIEPDYENAWKNLPERDMELIEK